jgi:hypothetical protein
LFLISEVIIKSLSELMEIWWSVIISIFRRYCYFEFFAFNKYFLKASSRGDKIFTIDNRFCDLYIKNNLNRRSKFNPKIMKMLFFFI